MIFLQLPCSEQWTETRNCADQSNKWNSNWNYPHIRFVHARPARKEIIFRQIAQCSRDSSCEIWFLFSQFGSPASICSAWIHSSHRYRIYINWIYTNTIPFELRSYVNDCIWRFRRKQLVCQNHMSTLLKLKSKMNSEHKRTRWLHRKHCLIWAYAQRKWLWWSCCTMPGSAWCIWTLVHSFSSNADSNYEKSVQIAWQLTPISLAPALCSRFVRITAVRCAVLCAWQIRLYILNAAAQFVNVPNGTPEQLVRCCFCFALVFWFCFYLSVYLFVDRKLFRTLLIFIFLLSLVQHLRMILQPFVPLCVYNIIESARSSNNAPAMWQRSGHRVRSIFICTNLISS